MFANRAADALAGEGFPRRRPRWSGRFEQAALARAVGAPRDDIAIVVVCRDGGRRG